MSSNETVNVQRSDLIRLQENIDPHRGAVAWGIVCNLLGMPSGQNQDKPVAGELREAFDSLLDALQLAGHEKEFNKAIGRYKYNQPAFELFQRLAARADAGEVERLREEVQIANKREERANEAIRERDALRDKLTEVVAKLEEAYSEGWNDGQEAIEQRYQSTPRTSTEGWERFKADNDRPVSAEPAKGGAV